ncbi:MAG TPA: metalloregulator ArsR/SmtB family transcription factor [Terriglobia bacterium]|nr:metalloregulator ArsR/SmtB family transcription factor [Terriglobia bacterium]
MRDLEGYFKGLSDATRLRIMNLLLQGELCVCDIQRIVAGTQPTISRHLNYLKQSGLVVDRRDGLRVFYRVARENNSDLRILHQFLRKAFKGKRVLEDDLKELKEAMARGACAVPTAFRSHRPKLSDVTSSRAQVEARRESNI